MLRANFNINALLGKNLKLGYKSETNFSLKTLVNVGRVAVNAVFLFSGYSFLLFQDEVSVQNLIDACIMDDDKLYWCVSSPTMKNKPVCMLGLYIA